MFNLADIFDLFRKVVVELINSGVDVRDGGNEVRLSENAYITSDASSSGDSLGITHTLERLNLPG